MKFLSFITTLLLVVGFACSQQVVLTPDDNLYKIQLIVNGYGSDIVIKYFDQYSHLQVETVHDTGCWQTWSKTFHASEDQNIELTASVNEIVDVNSDTFVSASIYVDDILMYEAHHKHMAGIGFVLSSLLFLD